MKVRTLWHDEGDDGPPWLVAAVDMFSVDYNGELPDDYTKELSRCIDKRRELVIEIPDSAVTDLFRRPVVRASVVKTDTYVEPGPAEADEP
jgi:hypothetical protein